MSYEYPYECTMHQKVRIVDGPVSGFHILQATWEHIRARRTPGVVWADCYPFDIGYRFVKKIDVTNVALVVELPSGMPIDPRERYTDFMIGGHYYLSKTGSAKILERAAKVFQEDILARIELLRLMPVPSLERHLCVWDHWLEVGTKKQVTVEPVGSNIWRCPYHGELPQEFTEWRLIDTLFPL